MSSLPPSDVYACLVDSWKEKETILNNYPHLHPSTLKSLFLSQKYNLKTPFKGT
jgi:hypothetical protein